jgi:hypothetical protein
MAAAIATGGLALGVGASLVGAGVASGDPGPTTAPDPPPPTTGTGGGGGGGGVTTSSGPTSNQPTTPAKPPARAHDLRVSAPKPGRILLTWKLVHPSAVAHVFVLRGPAGRCPATPIQRSATRIGTLDPRSHQLDTTEHDRTRYCYAVFTLDAAGQWAPPATHLARNKGDLVPPAPVSGVSAALGAGGAIHVTWTNPPDAAHDVVVRGHGSTCPHFESDGTTLGNRRPRESQVDSSVPGSGSYCYAVFAYDAAGNASPLTTTTYAPAPPPATSPTSSPTPPPSQPSSSGSSLATVVGLVGGGAIVLTGLAYATLRLVRREWEWHARTGYGIRDLMSVDVHGYDRTALLIPAVIGVCIAGAVVVLLMSL